MAGGGIAVSKNKSLRTLYEEFGGSTSMHGIGRVITNTSMCSRFVWSVLTLFGLGIATYQIEATMKDYYSYPVTTMVKLKSEKKTIFPGITICNLNKKKESNISEELREKIFELLSKDEFEIDSSPNDTKLNAHMRSNDWSNAYSAHNISDMLIKCVFNRRTCSQNDFKLIKGSIHGRCYSFVTTVPQIRPGPQYGLILELNIEQYEYLPISSKAGVKVIVHPQDEYPFPEDGGILARPGVATSIGIKKIITHRLPAPYSTCGSGKGQASSQPSLFPDWKYSQKACMKSCYQFKLYEQCECCDIDVPCKSTIIFKLFPQKEKKQIHVPSCISKEKLDCESFVENQFLAGELDCDERCPLECDRTTFDTVVSGALWPSDSSSGALSKIVNGTVLQDTSFLVNTSLERFIRSNFLKLEIFLDNLEFQEFTAQAKYDWILLLGNIGGLMGLWLGFSLLTAMEIVEVLVYTGLYYTRRKNRINIQPKTN